MTDVISGICGAVNATNKIFPGGAVSELPHGADAKTEGPEDVRARKHQAWHGLGTDYERAQDPTIASGAGERRYTELLFPVTKVTVAVDSISQWGL